MKKPLLFLLFVSITTFTKAQIKLGIGLKAGANFANVTNASSFNSSNASGFMVGGWLGGKRKLLSFRTELIFSRQGYDYKTSTNSGTVRLDYLLLPQLVTINLGKYLSIQGGGQIAFLLTANVDSASANNNSFGDIMDFLNRFDYGVVLGAEIFPYRGFLIGARYNRSLHDLYKSVTYSGGQINFASPDLKNNVVQLYAGWRF